jgi:DNA topoisomerase-3
MRRAGAAGPTGLVGMNLSRAYTLTYGDELSVGRVQTPTLAMVVERELAVRRFVPEDYLEVTATFRPTAQPSEAEAYKGTWVRDVRTFRNPRGFQPMALKPAQIVARAKTGLPPLNP